MGIAADIEEFAPDRAAHSDLVGFHRLRVAVAASDSPEDPTPEYEAEVANLRNPPPELSPSRYWVARRAGTIAGIARVALPVTQNRTLAMTNVLVHPGCRRAGIGTALLRAVLPAVRDDGRDVVGGAVLDGHAGAEWARGLGFRVSQRIVFQRLVLADVDHARWRFDPPAGYRLARWTGRAPDGLVDSYARARTAIDDAPSGGATWENPQWTVDVVRRREEEWLRQGAEQRVVVAVHEATGEVAGLTELVVHRYRPELGYQQDTSVRREHRGRGLGRCMKGAMLRWLVAERPALRFVQTTTSAENGYMINVNHDIGYATVRTVLYVEAQTRQLTARG